MNEGQNPELMFTHMAKAKASKPSQKRYFIKKL
jgi:hypothetical protein